MDRLEKFAQPTVESLDLRGCIYLEQQKFGEARKAFADAHQLRPNTFAPRIHDGDVLLRQQKFAEAREVYQGLLAETNILVANERLRFGVLLTYLGEHKEGHAQEALQGITFPTETPATITRRPPGLSRTIKNRRRRAGSTKRAKFSTRRRRSGLRNISTVSAGSKTSRRFRRSTISSAVGRAASALATAGAP